MVAVPLPLLVNVTPPGSPPLSLIFGAGVPDAVTVNDPNTPVWNVTAFPLVKDGACPIVKFEVTVLELPTVSMAVTGSEAGPMLVSVIVSPLLTVLPFHTPEQLVTVTFGASGSGVQTKLNVKGPVGYTAPF